jgi:hypothetical protein
MIQTRRDVIGQLVQDVPERNYSVYYCPCDCIAMALVRMSRLPEGVVLILRHLLSTQLST